MSMGNSGLFRNTAGARAAEADAPIGFDEMPPEDTCPMTNGEKIRSLDSRQLAEFLADTEANDVWDLGDNVDAWEHWLDQPYNETEPYALE